MNSSLCLLVLSLVGAAVAATTAKDPTCSCSAEDKQEDRNSRLRIAWLLLQDYKTKLEINALENELHREQTAFNYEQLAPADLDVLTNSTQPECACGRNVERERQNTYLRTAYLTLFSFKAQLEIIKLQKSMGLPQSEFDLDKISWPENVLSSTASHRVRRQSTCSNGCILYCSRYGGVRYNKDGTCTNGIKCLCIKPTPFP